MKTFRKKSIWRCGNTYLCIIFIPLFFVAAVMYADLIFTHYTTGIYTLGDQVILSVTLILLSICTILFCYALFNSLKYITIDQEYIIFTNAVTNREVKYLFSDINAVEITGSRMSDMLKLTFKSGKSKYVTVDMVPNKQLNTIYQIINERVFTA